MYGEFLKRVRLSRGLSQSALAATMGISQPNLSAYERDRRLPSADTLNKILVACGYELAATDGRHTIYCPLPNAGWFPDDDLPPPEPDDPVAEIAIVGPDATPDERAAALVAVLELAQATR